METRIKALLLHHHLLLTLHLLMSLQLLLVSLELLRIQLLQLLRRKLHKESVRNWRAMLVLLRMLVVWLLHLLHLLWMVGWRHLLVLLRRGLAIIKHVYKLSIGTLLLKTLCFCQLLLYNWVAHHWTSIHWLVAGTRLLRLLLRIGHRGSVHVRRSRVHHHWRHILGRLRSSLWLLLLIVVEPTHIVKIHLLLLLSQIVDLLLLDHLRRWLIR